MSPYFIFWKMKIMSYVFRQVSSLMKLWPEKITTGKKKYYVSLFGSVGKWFLVLFTYLVYNTVVIFFLFLPYLSCFQNNPPENNVERVPTKTSTTFSKRLFWRQLRFGGNWLHIIFRRIVLEAAQIWRKQQQQKLTTVLYTKYVNNTKNYFPTEPNKLT